MINPHHPLWQRRCPFLHFATLIPTQQPRWDYKTKHMLASSVHRFTKSLTTAATSTICVSHEVWGIEAS